MAELNSAIWQQEPGWLQKKRQLATMLRARFTKQDDQDDWLGSWQGEQRRAGQSTGLVSHDGDYVAQPLSQAVNEYSEMLQENLMEKAIFWQDGQLNAAHLSRIDGGQFIYVPDGTALTAPIELAPTMTGENPHNVFIVGAGSQVTIQETAQLTNPGSVYAGTEILVGTGATVTYRQFNHFAGQRALQAVHVYQAQGSQFHLAYGQSSATDVTTSLYSFLDGQQTKWTADVALQVPAGAHQECRPVLDGYGQETTGRLYVWGQSATPADLKLDHFKVGSGEPLDIAEEVKRLAPDSAFNDLLPAASWLKNKFERA